MQAIDIKSPEERKKLIWAVLLGALAILFLWWAFFGFGGSSKSIPKTVKSVVPPTGSQTAPNPTDPRTPAELKGVLGEQLSPVVFSDTLPAVTEAKRNIFVYYEKPPPMASASVMPTPTATPTPPVLLAAVSPANVYARTDDFQLEVTGDKFTPELRITIDGRELPTRYLNPQQLSATVSASIIATTGGRQVLLRSADGKLYSNIAVLNVSPPPTPNYNYVGIIGTQRYVDTAILQDKGSREVLNVQRGDVLGGRFRVTSISEKELVLVDTNLKIKHSLRLSSDGEKGIGPQSRPTPKVDSEDDEP
jgi:hypothetical protein